jgi:hypothetical protein
MKTFWQIAIAVVLILAVSPLTAATGRWKREGTRCVWHPTDIGPNQCDPNAPAPTGRYKINGATCYWEKNDSGPNQCDPNTALGQPPLPDPDNLPPIQSRYTLEGGTVFNGGSPLTIGDLPSCEAYVQHGNIGWISVQTNKIYKPDRGPGKPEEPLGQLAIGMGMHNIKYNFGIWWSTIHVNGIAHNPKVRFYPIHDSLHPSHIPPNALIRIVARHFFWQWTIGYTYDPEFGWRPYGYWAPALAGGQLNCSYPPI